MATQAAQAAMAAEMTGVRREDYSLIPCRRKVAKLIDEAGDKKQTWEGVRMAYLAFVKHWFPAYRHGQFRSVQLVLFGSAWFRDQTKEGVLGGLE